MSEEILIAEEIVKSYREGKNKLVVLNGASLRVKKGEKVIITGPSGSGKSTLLHLLGGLQNPDSGRIIIKGVNITQFSEDRRAEIRKKYIGFVFQYHYLFSEFTALENVMVPLILSGKSEKKAREKALYLLSLMGIAERKDHRPNELSGGEAQRVQVARAIANEPEILLLDEPTGNLDHKRAISLMELFIKLNEEMGTTLCMVSHNRELEQFFDYRYSIRNGKVVRED